MSLHYAGSYHKMVIDILKTLVHFLSVISSGNHLKSLMSSLFADVGHRQLFVTSSPKGNDRSPENKQVFSNSSLVSKRFFQLVRADNSAVHG